MDETHRAMAKPKIALAHSGHTPRRHLQHLQAGFACGSKAGAITQEHHPLKWLFCYLCNRSKIFTDDLIGDLGSTVRNRLIKLRLLQ